MNVLNRQSLLWLLLTAGLAVVSHVDHLPKPLAVWFFVLFGWRCLGIWRQTLLPNAAARLFLVIMGLGLLVGLYPGHWGAASGSAVFVVALAVKLLELNHERDAYLVGYLSLIVVGSVFLFRVDIWAATLGLLVLWGWLSVLMNLNDTSVRPKKLFKRTGIILLEALPLTIMLFVLFPRIQAPSWQWLKTETSTLSQSGLSDVLEPGSISHLALSPQRAFRVKFDGEMPPRNQLYWRGPVFSFTDGQRWSVNNDDEIIRYQDQIAFAGNPYRYTLLLEPQKQNWVFALDMPAQYGGGIYRNANYQLIGQHKAGDTAEYEIVSHPDYNTGYITRTEYRQNRQLPYEPSDRIVDLVKRLQGFETKPEVFIERLLAYFREQKFSYTLNPPLMGEQPIDKFLFEAKTGFCNHYATAFVYLMRVADIPARVVGGYQGGEFNEVGQFLEVKQANAHAWAEVWLKDKGWVRVDPTAVIVPERLEQPIDVSQQIQTGTVSLMAPEVFESGYQGVALKQTVQLIASLDYQWQRWVIHFGGDQQFMRLGSMDWASVMPKIYSLMVGVGMTMLLLIRWLFRDRRRPEVAQVQLYRCFCLKMAKIGVPVFPGEPPLNFASRAKMEKPELADWIDEVTRLFLQLHYYPGAGSRQLKRFKRLIKSR